MKTIVVHRDGRDVAATIARRFRGRWRHLVDDPEHQHFTSLVDTAEKVAHHWVDAVRLSDELRGPVRTVRYEDLVREPEAVLREVGDWLDVDPERFDHGGLHTDEVGIHRSELSDADARAVVDIAGATMARLGYEVP